MYIYIYALSVLKTLLHFSVYIYVYMSIYDYIRTIVVIILFYESSLDLY